MLTRLDALEVENARLKSENERLRDSHVDMAAHVDAEAEVARLTEFADMLQKEKDEAADSARATEAKLQEMMEAITTSETENARLVQDLERSEVERTQLQVENSQLTGRVDKLEMANELERLRAVEEER